MKKFIVSLMAAIAIVFGIGQIAQAKEVRSTEASATAESSDWKNYLDTWTTTQYGNRFMIRHEGDSFIVVFDYEEDLGTFKGAKLEDATITYHFDSMNNAIVDEFANC